MQSGQHTLPVSLFVINLFALLVLRTMLLNLRLYHTNCTFFKFWHFPQLFLLAVPRLGGKPGASSLTDQSVSLRLIEIKFSGNVFKLLGLFTIFSSVGLFLAVHEGVSEDKFGWLRDDFKSISKLLLRQGDRYVQGTCGSLPPIAVLFSELIKLRRCGKLISDASFIQGSQVRLEVWLI